MKLGYYPGCSMHGTSREHEESLKAIAEPLAMELVELEDWSCCGATSAHATNHLLSIVLPARNLAIAERQGLASVMTPCAACYSRLAAAKHEINKNRAMSEKVANILGKPVAASLSVLSIVEALRNSTAAIKEKSRNPLKGLKVACYYGCLLVRPPDITGFDDTEQPTSMEKVAEACGATPVEWTSKVDCCGGGFSLSRIGSVVRLGRAVIRSAQASGAQVIAVACPMCHSNLDFRQKAMGVGEQGDQKPMPVIFLTQLVGLAMGFDAKTLGLDRHFVDTKPLLQLIDNPAGEPKPREVA